MRYYPIFLDLENRPCLVIGGGQVGERKVRTLQECGAKVRLISREMTPYLEREVQENRLLLLAQDYKPELMEACFLVIGATDDPLVNRQISREAMRRGILCNIVDSPRDCNFILPSLVRRGDLVLAVSTSGKSPALAKKIRRQLEKDFPEIYELYLKLLGKIRLHLLAQARPQEDNQRLFETLVDSPLLSWLASGDFKAVTGFLADFLDPPLPLSELAVILNPPFPPNQ